MSKYKTGVVLGRFQPIHLGHVHVINEALNLCEKVLVFIGSSQAELTETNPFNYELRKTLIQKVFGDKILIAPLPDQGLGNVNAWGDFIIKEAEKFLGKVDAFVLGKEVKNNTWFRPEHQIALVEIDHADVPGSATQCRALLKEGNQEAWKRMSPPQIHEDYEFLRSILLSISSGK